jgi:hypothetical protein
MTCPTLPDGQGELDLFERRLMAELQDRFAGRSALDLLSGERTGPTRGRTRLRVPALAIVIAFILIAAALVTTGHDQPAYAVIKAPDGDLVVTIHSSKDAEGLERKLRELGVIAQVSFSAGTVNRRTTRSGPPKGHTRGGPRSQQMIANRIPQPIVTQEQGDWVVTIPGSTLHKIAVLQMYLSSPEASRGCCSVSYVRWVAKTH